MSKIYDKSAAAFKATTIDTKILDAQNIKVYPGEGSLDTRVNLLDLITSSGTSEEQGGGNCNPVDSEIVRELKNWYSTYSNLVFPLSTEAGGNVYTSSFRFGYKHCPKGLIKKISLYARDANSASHDSKTNGCYLIAKVYNKADSSLVRQQTSSNKVVVREKQSNETERPLNTWEFDGILAPNENEIIKFIPSPDGENQVADYYLGFYVDTTHTHNDCQCGGDWDYINDPLRAGEKMLALCEMEGDFYQDKEIEKGLTSREKDFFNSLYTLTTSNQKIWDNNVNNESVGQGQCKAFTLVRPYITNGVFSEVRWDSQGTINSTVYCRLTLRDTNGKDVKTLVSGNTENFSAPGVKSFRFNEEFEITDNIGSLLFETSTDGVNPSTAQWRIRIIGNATKPNTDGGEMAANNPYICQVIFWGKTIQLSNNILTTASASSTYATKTELDNYVTNDDAANFVTKEELDSYQQKQQYYDTWTNLKDGDIVDKADAYSFQLDKNDFVSGRIDRIEIPYIKGGNATGHLCVQFFDSSNNVIDTYYSINKQTQNITGEHARGICEYEFVTFETPEDYSFVRFSMVANTWRVPTGNSGIQFRVSPIKRNNTFTWNTNTNTKINNTGTGWTILLSVLTRNYAKNTGITVRNYDWTPDVFCPINVTLSTAGAAFVAPTNGWIISKSAQTTSGANSLTLNGIEIAKSSGSAQVDLQILMRKGEFVTATTAYNLVFYPCKSEQFDYRLEGGNTIYDIWKGAVVYDEFGQPTVKDLYIPDASSWKSEVGNAVIGRISTISDEAAYDASGNKLFNIQSGAIENGKGLLVGSTITTWNASLESLRVGEQMFGYSNINTWNTALPLMWKGDNMFYGCTKLTTFNASLPALTSGWHMFTNCSTLSDVTIGSLSSLTDGTNMFKGCGLSYASLNNILNALPQRTATIDITVADSAADDMAGDDRFRGVEVPPFNGSTYFSFTHNGWEVRLTSRTGFIVGQLAPTPYDVTEANGYIPDASAWNEDNKSIINNITRVSNEIAYNDNN